MYRWRCLIGQYANSFPRYATTTLRSIDKMGLKSSDICKCNSTLVSQKSTEPVKSFVHNSLSQSFHLRDYQEDCIQSCCKALEEGVRRVAVSLATGGGKTVIFSHLISRVKPYPGYGGSTLIVAHREELIQQTYEKIIHIHPELSVEIERGASHASGSADITIASIKSISQKRRLAKFNPENYKLIIVDEAHHAPSSTYVRLFEHFGALDPKSKVAVAGFTATLYRNDTKALGKMFDDIVFHRDLLDMIKSKWLCRACLTTVSTDVDLSNVPTNRVNAGNPGEFKEKILSELVNTANTNQLVVNTWNYHSKGGQKYISTMVFCVDIEHAINVANTFRDNGVRAEVVTSKTERAERRELIDDFKAQKYPVLVNCGVFTEGTDIPNIDMIILNRPTTSPGLLTQMLGRGLRTHPNKDHCHIIDMVGKVNPNMATVPTLFGSFAGKRVENSKSLDEVAEEAAEEALEISKEIYMHESNKIDKDSVKITFETYDNLESFMRVKDNSRDRISSELNWLRISDSEYILGSSYGYMRLERHWIKGSKPLYRLYKYFPIPLLPGQSRKGAKYRKVEQFTNVDNMKEAIEKADNIAMTSNFSSQLTKKGQKWRKAPASEQQVAAFYNRLSRLPGDIVRELEKYNLVNAKEMDKGQLADFLTKLIIGGNKVFRWMLSVERRKETLRSKVLSKQKNL